MHNSSDLSIVFVPKMTAHQKMTIRVFLTEADIRKVILNKRPATVEDLISKLKESLELDDNISLQYKDPAFNYELCSPTGFEDLPEKSTVKVIPVLELAPVSGSNDVSSDTPSEADTERQKQWPEHRLRQANLRFMSEGKHVKVTKDLKHKILDIYIYIYSFNPYPTIAQFGSVAAALTSKHPCFRE